jgi:hypothetical protein
MFNSILSLDREILLASIEIVPPGYAKILQIT